MSAEPVHPVAQAILGGGADEPDREYPCSRCGKPTVYLGFILAAVKTYNRMIAKPGETIGKARDMGICCNACTPLEYNDRHAAQQRENEQSLAYLRMLYAGKYNPESLAWLRSHGYAAQVARHLAKEGTTKAHG